MSEKKAWYKRWWAITVYVIIGIFVLAGLFGEDNSNNSTINQKSDSNLEANNQELGGIIKAPDTRKVLFTLNDSIKIDGDCSMAKSLSEYGVILSKDCKGITSYNSANYCELGNQKGENANYFYCRPIRFIQCNILDSSGNIEDVKYYGFIKVLNCTNKTEQLINILVDSYTEEMVQKYN